MQQVHEHVRGRRRWILEEQWTDAGVRLVGTVHDDGGRLLRRTSCDVRVRHGVCARLVYEEHAFLTKLRPKEITLPWLASPSLPPHRLGTDALGHFVQLVAYGPERLRKSQRGFDEGLGFLIAFGDDVTRRLHALLPPAHAEALRHFAPATRFELLAEFDADPSGRLVEKARRQPGLLLLLLALKRANDDAAAHALRQGIVHGKRLAPTIEAAITAHRSHHPDFVGLALDEETLRTWRLLVMRAGHHVEPSILLLPPPLRFAPEDIPKTRAANARWYRAMSIDDAIRSPALGQLERGRAFSHFMSVHGWRFVFPSLIDSVRHFLDAHPGFNPRQLGYAQTRDRLIAHMQARFPRLGIEEGTATAADPKAPLPPPPMPGLQSEDLELEPLDTLERLQKESAEMSHCASTYMAKVQRRESYLYAARVLGARLTVEVTRGHNDTWRIAQVRGKCNALPSPQQVSALERWCPVARAGTTSGRWVG